MREERDGSSLGLLVKLVLVAGLVLIIVSLVAHILQLLFVVAVIWLIGFVGLTAYRVGRRRGR
jgi:Flp pilus assembly protein TadB